MQKYILFFLDRFDLVMRTRRSISNVKRNLRVSEVQTFHFIIKCPILNSIFTPFKYILIIEAYCHFLAYSGKANAVYIYGEDYSPADCNKYMEDFRNCKLWRDSYSMEALVSFGINNGKNTQRLHFGNFRRVGLRINY